uniref:JmjC domain-containing protein n=1 Tax=Sinocyclocheilus grahami TaxID=75366 RepID=A0A672SZ83_SINGR
MDRETFNNCCSLVKMPRQIHQQHCSSHFIQYIEREIAYSKFIKNYLIPNQPCMFSKKFTEDWNCRKKWVTADGKPNLQRLLQEFDETPVPVANCSAKEYNSNPKQIMPFKEFIQYWREYIQNGHSSPKGCLYLKDWHMQRNFPEHNSYKTPIYFSSDWLNEYWDTIEVDDYRFVYMGPKGSWYCVIYLSYTVEDTISINHNWLNGCNLDIMWQFLQEELSSVQREIEEWRDTMDSWHQHCQVIMKSCTGIDYGEFASFLKTIANNRMSFLNSCPRNADNCQDHLAESLFALGPQHAAFDLQRVLHIFESMLGNEDFKRLDPSTLTFKPEELLQEIREAVRTIV